MIYAYISLFNLGPRDRLVYRLLIFVVEIDVSTLTRSRTFFN